MVAVFGRIVFPDGWPVGGAQLVSERAFGQTDREGRFQIDVVDGAVLDLAAADGRTCRIALPELADDRAFVSLGNLVCRPTQLVKLDAAEPARPREIDK